MDAREDFMLHVGIDSTSVKTIAEANYFVNKWIFSCRNNDEYKFLKISLESIRKRFLYERYSYEKTGHLTENEEFELHKKFSNDFEVFSPLLNFIESEWNLYKLQNKFQVEYTEKDMQTDIINNFSNLFPQYSFIAKEYKTSSHGRVDILAKDNTSKRDVIIELKLHKNNPNRQLFDYANDFNNPILIAITQDKLGHKARRENIIYYTFNNQDKTVQLV